VDNLAESLEITAKAGGKYTRAITDLLQITNKASRDKKNQTDYEKESFAFAKRNRYAAVREFSKSLTGPNGVGSAIGNLGQYIEKGIGTMPVVGPAIGFAAGALTGLAQQLFQSRDTFMSMVDQGIMFGGSVTKFRADVAGAGLTVDQFAAIAQNSGAAIQQFGENNFLKTTNSMQSFFEEFGLKLQDGNEWFAEYLENSRLSGTLYLRSIEEQKVAFEESVKQQRELNKLTGASGKKQREEERRLAEMKKLNFLLASVSNDQATAMEKAGRVLINGLGAKAEEVEAIKLQAITGAPTKVGADLQQVIGAPMFNQIMDAMRTGQTDIIASPEFREQLAQRYEQLSKTQPGMAYGQRGPELIERMGMMVAARASVRRPAEPTPAPTPGGVAPDTQTLTGLQNTVNTALGQIQEGMLRLIAGPLESLAGWLKSMNSIVMAGTSAGPGEGLKKMAEAMGGENTPLGRIAGSFSKDGIFAGITTAIGEVLSVAWKTLKNTLEEAWDSLVTRLKAWGAGLVEMIASILPSYIRNKTPKEIEDDLVKRAKSDLYKENERRAVASGGIIPLPATKVDEALNLRVDKEAASKSKIGETAYMERAAQIEKLQAELKAQQQNEYVDPKIWQDILSSIQLQTRILNSSIQNQ
jgi:membrane protein involved in colicin uptake